jgi:hypothetical protein
MGIVEEELVNFKLTSGESIRIELNEGGGFHLHIDNILIPLSEEEIWRLAESVEKADSKLKEMKTSSDDF